MKKPTIKEMRRGPSLWAKQVPLGMELRICYPNGSVEACLSWHRHWMISAWTPSKVKKNCQFVGWL